MCICEFVEFIYSRNDNDTNIYDLLWTEIDRFLVKHFVNFFKNICYTKNYVSLSTTTRLDL